MNESFQERYSCSIAVQVLSAVSALRIERSSPLLSWMFSLGANTVRRRGLRMNFELAVHCWVEMKNNHATCNLFYRSFTKLGSPDLLLDLTILCGQFLGGIVALAHFSLLQWLSCFCYLEFGLSPDTYVTETNARHLRQRTAGVYRILGRLLSLWLRNYGSSSSSVVVCFCASVLVGILHRGQISGLASLAGVYSLTVFDSCISNSLSLGGGNRNWIHSHL